MQMALRRGKSGFKQATTSKAKSTNKAGAYQRFLIYCRTAGRPLISPSSSLAHQIQDVFFLTFQVHFVPTKLL